MSSMLKIMGCWLVGCALLVGGGFLLLLASVAEQVLARQLGTPAAAALLMLGLAGAVLGLVHAWLMKEASDLKA
jgi:hypothetical protein